LHVVESSGEFEKEAKMSIKPEGEPLRNAVKWISEQRKEGRGDDKQLVADAALQFNLSPKETEYLQRFLKEGEGA
jgi:cation transport regulator ChaC